MTIPILTATTVMRPEEPFTSEEELALRGFLAGYSGLTLDAHSLDLRQYATWCTEHQIQIFGARRADKWATQRASILADGPGMFGR